MWSQVFHQCEAWTLEKKTLGAFEATEDKSKELEIYGEYRRVKVNWNRLKRRGLKLAGNL